MPSETEQRRRRVNPAAGVLLRESILKRDWQDQPFITPCTVDVHVALLRQKLGDQPPAPRHIVTVPVRGKGNRFEP